MNKNVRRVRVKIVVPVMTNLDICRSKIGIVHIVKDQPTV